MSETQSDIIMKVRGLKKNFATLEVIKGVDLDIRRGEVVVIIGPSGSGKSTFLRCLNGLEEPSGGDICMEGINLCKKSAAAIKMRQKIGMVFQNFNLFLNFTVIDNITLALQKVAKITKQESTEIALRYLNLVGLPDKRDSYPADRASELQLRARWQWRPTSCCSTSRRARWTRR